jgi:hypothetical protein
LYQMDIAVDRNFDHFLTLGRANSSVPVFPYGMQEQVISFALPGVLAADDEDVEWGPTYFFQTSYDKIIILPETTGVGTRDVRSLSTRDVTQPGDLPWFCFWNSSLLEVFIYINLTSSSGAKSTSTSTSAISPTGTASSINQAYPKVVKVENSATNSSINPYCQQMQILSDGSAVPLLTR